MFQNHSFVNALFFAQLLQNHKVSFVPGWDCHGLPIELKGEFTYKKVYGNAQVPIIWCSHDHILDFWINYYKFVCLLEIDQVLIANYFLQF